MDLFTRERSGVYVTAFAGRLMLAIGKGIASGGGELRRIGEEDGESIWTLALMLVRWYGAALPVVEGNIVTALLGDEELVPILENLSAFRAQLLPFVRAAHEAQSEPRLAAAGVYFVGAVQQVGVSLLAAAIKSGPVAVVRDKLLARFPLPSEIKAAYAAVLRGEAVVERERVMPPRAAATNRASRGERFERAGFERRTRSADTATARVREIEAPTVPTVPQLSGADVTRAYLLTVRWESDEVERLMAGPNPKQSS